MKIYVFGSLNVDYVGTLDRFPDRGETITGSDLFVNAGGKGANQAFTAAKLGADVTMIGTVGDDGHGRMQIGRLSRVGVDVSHIAKSPEHPTGMATIFLQDGDNRIVVYPGANHANQMDHLRNALAGAREGDLFLTQFECNRDVVLEAIRYVGNKKMTVIVNPSPYQSMPKDVWAAVDILVLNETESRQMFGVPGTSKDERAHIRDEALDMGMSEVLLTLGEHGVWHMGEHAIHHIPALDVDVIDTTGAGDAFTGGFTASLAQGTSHEQAISNGVLAAGYAITKKGVEDAMPTMDDLKRFKAKTT